MTISTDRAPAAVGPYSQAIRTGTMLFTSGQHLGAILEEAGYEKTDVVKTTVYIKDMNDFAAVNRLYAEFFGDHKPARSCVEAARLPKDGLVEIEAIAVRE